MYGDFKMSDEARLERELDREFARREREQEREAYTYKMLRDDALEGTQTPRRGGVERFTRAEFEEAIRSAYRSITSDKYTDFHPMGLDMGEWSYRFMISESISVVIRSSVDSTGIAAETGADSIRLIVECSDGTGWYAVGKGADAYTTRVKGWQMRLEAKIREIAKRYGGVGMLARGERAYIVKKAGPNKGRAFVKGDSGSFRWID